MKQLSRILNEVNKKMLQQKIMCNKCVVAMEECEEDYESMSEGQMADYDAGLWRTYWCPSCKVATVIEGQFSTPYMFEEDEELEELKEIELQVEKEELVILRPKEKLAKDNVIRGDYNEYLARKLFTRKGFNMIKLVEQKHTAEGLGYHSLNEIEILQYCQRFNQEELCEYLCKTPIAGLPDFLCIDESQFFFVECKCNPKKMKESQKEKIKELRQLGYEVKIFSTPIKSIDISYDRTIIYSLK